jgi:hypothetical protein
MAERWAFDVIVDLAHAESNQESCRTLEPRRFVNFGPPLMFPIVALLESWWRNRPDLQRQKRNTPC